MAVTSASATIQFNVGSFDYQTGLNLPPTTYTDKITPKFNEFITDVLNSPIVFVVYRQTFQGALLYEHPQFNANFALLEEITNPDIQLDEGSSSDDVTINKLLDIIKTSAGEPASGQYVITMRYAYYFDGEEALTPLTVTYTINFSSPTVEPTISYWYDTIVPTLTITDGANYTSSGVTATQDTEFRLFPPMSGTPNTTTGTALSVNYGSFWTGKNELQYTILLSYLFTSHEVLMAFQTYNGVPVVNTNRKEVYNCLKLIYEQWKSCPCGTKQYDILEDKVQEATILAQLIVSGSGCGLDTLTELVERFNRITGCDCSKPSLTPRFITAGLIAETAQVQFITATTSNTIINLALGNKIYMELDVDTEISFINESENEKYTLIVTSYDGFSATFSDEFSWGGGWELAADPAENQFGVSTYYFEEFEGKLVAMIPFSVPEPLNDGEKNVLREQDGSVFWEPLGTGDFISVGDNISLLTNDAGYATQADVFKYLALSGVGSSAIISLASGFNVLEVSSTSASVALSIANRGAITLGRPYVIMVRNTGASPMTVSLAAGDFTDNYTTGAISSTIATSGAKTFVFFGSQPDGFSNKTLLLASRAENYMKVGDNISLLNNNANFIASGANISLLNNNVGYITNAFSYSAIGNVSGFNSVDFANDGEFQQYGITGDATFAAEGIVEGKKYALILRNTSGTTNRVITFASPSFVDVPSIVLQRGQNSFVSLEFIGVFISGATRLVQCTQEARPLHASTQAVPTEVSATTLSIDVSLNPSPSIDFIGTETVHTLSLTNPLSFREYTLMISNNGSVTKAINFASPTVYDITGSTPEITIQAGSKVIIVIQSTFDDGEAIIKSVTPNTDDSGSAIVAGDDVSLLTNDIGYITTPFVYENVGPQGNYAADFSNKDIVYLQVTSAGSTLSATGVTEGRKYTFVIRNTDVTGNAYIFFNGSTFQNSPAVTIPAFINASLIPSVYSFEFIAVNTGTLVRLVPSTSNLPSIVRGYEVSPPSTSWVFDANSEKEVQYNIDEDLTIAINNARAFESYRIILHNSAGISVDVDFATPSAFVPTIYDGTGASPTYTLTTGQYAVIGIQMTANDAIGVVAYKTPN